jgi:hypothetical protein
MTRIVRCLLFYGVHLPALLVCVAGRARTRDPEGETGLFVGRRRRGHCLGSAECPSPACGVVQVRYRSDGGSDWPGPEVGRHQAILYPAPLGLLHRVGAVGKLDGSVVVEHAVL